MDAKLYERFDVVADITSYANVIGDAIVSLSARTGVTQMLIEDFRSAVKRAAELKSELKQSPEYKKVYGDSFLDYCDAEKDFWDEHQRRQNTTPKND